LEGGKARYLARVLRLAPGDSFPGIDAAGRRWLCVLREAGVGRIVLEVRPLPPDWDEARHLDDVRRGARTTSGPAPEAAAAVNDGGATGRPSAPTTAIILVQGLPKGAKMDLIVRQAAEAGVARVIPLLASRSAQASDEQGGTGRRARWERIAREALQQSGSAVPTRVEAPIGLEDLAAALGESPGRRLCLLLDAEASPPLAQTSLHGYLTEAPDEIVLCVGPEGGFAAEETRALARAGFLPLKLPCAVLRTETAALYAVAAVETILSERLSWIPRVP